MGKVRFFGQCPFSRLVVLFPQNVVARFGMKLSVSSLKQMFRLGPILFRACKVYPALLGKSDVILANHLRQHLKQGAKLFCNKILSDEQNSFVINFG